MLSGTASLRFAFDTRSGDTLNRYLVRKFTGDDGVTTTALSLFAKVIFNGMELLLISVRLILFSMFVFSTPAVKLIRIDGCRDTSVKSFVPFLLSTTVDLKLKGPAGGGGSGVVPGLSDLEQATRKQSVIISNLI